MLSEINAVQFNSRSEILKKLLTLFLALANHICIILYLPYLRTPKKITNLPFMSKRATGLPVCKVKKALCYLLVFTIFLTEFQNINVNLP